MSAITSLLVRDGLVPVRTVVEALQRQVISGGDIETVLLEMDAVPENVLAAYRAALLDRPPATREEVMGVEEKIRKLVPAEVAIQNGLIPLHVSGSTLRIAVHDVLSAETAERLAFLLGYDLDLRVVCSLRIAGALAEYYGAELEPRVQRLLKRVQAREAGEPPRIGTGSESHLGSQAIDLPSKSLPPPSRPPEEVLGAFGASPDEPPPEARPRPGSSSHLRRLRGPMTLAAGERRLKRASTRDQILEIYFSFAQQFFDYTALFVVHDQVADGREAYGPGGARTSLVRGLSIPLDRPSVFSEAQRTRAPVVRRLDRTDVDRDIALGLRRGASPPAFIMPIAIRQRVVLILYGDRDGEEFDIGTVMELVRFGSRVVESFELLIIRNKRPGYVDGEPDPGAVAERRQLKGAARAVAQTAGSERPRSRRDSAAGWKPGRRRTNPGFAPPQAVTLPEMDTWKAPTDLAEPPPPRPRDPGPPASAAMSRIHPSDAPPSAVLGIPRNAPPPPDSAELKLERITLPGDDPDLSFDDADEVVLSMDDDEDEPELSFDAASDEDGDDTDEDDEDDEDDTGYDDDPIGEAPHYGAKASPKSVLPRDRPGGSYSLSQAPVDVVAAKGGRSSESSRSPKDPRREDEDKGEPPPEVVRIPDAVRSEPPPRPASAPPPSRGRSVIVDMGEQVHEQVDELTRTSNPRAWDALVRGLLDVGEPALPVLAQVFPGPLAWERSQGGALPRGRDLSGVARAICAFGDRAASYVTGLLSSDRADDRFYAVLVASELVHPDLMDAVAERIHDEDAGVRTLAVQLLPRFSSFRGFDEIRTVVRRTARLRGRNPARRWQAVDAVAAMRDADMIPKLIELLDEDDTELIQHLRRALNKLTGADLGRSRRKWLNWWTRHRDLHRIEWLIEGLLSPDESLRRLASEELTALTQEYYGYHPGSPKRDREKIAKRYQSWWEDEGRRRFG